MCCFVFLVQGNPEELGSRKMQGVTSSLFHLLLGLMMPKGEREKLKSKGTIFLKDALGPKTHPLLL